MPNDVAVSQVRAKRPEEKKRFSTLPRYDSVLKYTCLFLLAVYLHIIEIIILHE